MQSQQLGCMVLLCISTPRIVPNSLRDSFFFTFWVSFTSKVGTYLFRKTPSGYKSGGLKPLPKYYISGLYLMEKKLEALSLWTS